MIVKDIRGLALGCALLAAVLASGAPRARGETAPPETLDEAPPAGLEARDLASLPDGRLLLLARDLIQAGQPGPACAALDSFFAREGRNSELDWEAAVLREGCRAAPASGAPPASAASAAAEARPAVPRLNAIQVFTFHSPDPGRMDGELAALSERGVDTLIVRAFHNNGDRPLFRELRVPQAGVYFASARAPVAADCLGRIARAAHARGMRVLGWMTTRNSDWLISAHPEWLERQYDPELGRSVPSRGLSLFRPEVREALCAVYAELAASGVDGILFQDDLVMRWNEGFSGAAVQAFLDSGGGSPHPDDLFALPASPGKVPGFRPRFREWCGWKSRSLVGALREFAAAGRRVNPDLLVAANVYYETIMAPEQGLAWYGQDATALSGAADYLALMSYHRQITSELSLDAGKLLEVLEGVVGRARALAIDEARLIFKVQTTDWQSLAPIPEAEWDRVRRLFQEAGGFSLAVLRH